MIINLTNAMNNVDMTYDEVVNIANDTLTELTGDIDTMLQNAYENIDRLTNDSIRELLIRLSLRSYSFSPIKDKSAFKATLAEVLRKEAYAKQVNLTEGTVAVRENTATLNTSAEIVVEKIYDLTADLFRTKLDEVHRCVDTLKTVLNSRLSEARLTSIDPN
jgi:hypothetical protein